ncbi:cupin domain-containing protein [Halobaculum limi]|uniref:cupin domain-containing protein n=1 Tax=Halobaculum limi TaxID=3031916 RepID=UPI002405C1FD|nr:cupin domain-containing protein [Halobaculum sp. YSMS11]
MNHIVIDAVDPVVSTSPADTVRVLTEPLETESMAVNVFDLTPGDTIGYGLHRHLDQEEVFYVVDGRVTFETDGDDISVEAGEIIRFAPGEFQLGHNTGDGRARVFALGAPRDTEEVEYLIDCDVCGERTVQAPEVSEADRTVTIRCTECGTVTDEMDI